MKKTVLAVLIATAMCAVALTGCADDEAVAETATAAVESTAEEAVEEAAEAATEEGITFAQLQEDYAALTECYQTVEDLYMNDGIEQSDDIEELLTEAKYLIDEMGELSESDFTSASDMQEMEDAMVNIIDALGTIVDGMEVK